MTRPSKAEDEVRVKALWTALHRDLLETLHKYELSDDALEYPQSARYLIACGLIDLTGQVLVTYLAQDTTGSALGRVRGLIDQLAGHCLTGTVVDDARPH